MFKIIAFVVMSFAALPTWADRINAQVHCAAGDKDQLFNCVFNITKNHVPLEEAEFSVQAEMPTMPMAHNARPVPAHQMDQAGFYHAGIDIAMDGAWVLKLIFERPQRDLVIVQTHFPPHVSPSESHAPAHNH